MTYALGQTVELTFTTSPAEVGTLTVVRPDGTPGTAVLSGAAGSQVALVDADALGVWSYSWVSDNAGAQAGTFVVGTALLTLGEVKAHLNIPATDTSQDVELGAYLDAVVDLIEAEVGAVVARTVTETPAGSILRDSPVLSVDSVTVSGVAWTGTTTLNDEAGLLYGLPWGATVTYTAGRKHVPAAIKLAALVTLDRLWETQRGAQPLPVQGDESGNYVAQGGPDLPYRAQMLLKPYQRGSTVA